MLVLKRKVGESIRIGDNIEISVVEIGADKIKIAIDAPKEIPIIRSELIDAAITNKEAAADNANVSIIQNLIKINKR